MCQTIVARHNCLHRAMHIKKCAAAIKKKRGSRNSSLVWTKMTSFLSGTQHRIEPPNPHRRGWDEERLIICPGCRKLGHNDSQGLMIQGREDAKRRHARDIQLGKFVGQEPRSSAPTAQSRAPPMVQPPPRLAARQPHRSRFAEVGLASDTPISTQQTRPGIARQNAVRGHGSSNTRRQVHSPNRRPANHTRTELREVGDLQIPIPISISSREIRRNRGESKPLPPIPLRSQKQVFGRANSGDKQSVPRKPVAPPKSKGRSSPSPPLRLPTFCPSTETSPRFSPTTNPTSWRHANSDTGRLNTPATAQTPQISRFRESTVNAISPLSAVIINADEGLCTAPMDSYFSQAHSGRAAPSASRGDRVDSDPRLAPTLYHPPTSPPPSLHPGRRDTVPATPTNIGFDLDSVEEIFNRAASQAQARNQVRDGKRSNTSPRRTSNGRRSPRQSGSRRRGQLN